MSTNGWQLLDLVASVVAAAGWIGAGATASARRPRVAAALAGVALLASVGRLVTVGALAAAGWWFAQEKLLLTLPLQLAGVAAALAFATPGLRTAMAGPAGVAAADGAAPDGAVTDGAAPDEAAVDGAVTGRSASTAPGAVGALFVAGLAAAAGPAYTLVHGSSATWSGALLTVGLVGGAATVLARVLGLARLRAAAVASLALAVVGAALAFAGPPATDTGGGPAARTGTQTRTGTATGTGTTVTSLTGPTVPGPQGQVRRYTLTARTATVALPSGRRVAAWTFDGQVPGPAVTATVGDLVEVTLRNADIGEGVTLHWHGYDVPNAEDGVPGLTQDAVRPGGEYVYRFLADRPGTYWYHTHEVSDRGVRMGLYGMFVVAPRAQPATEDLTLPVHTLGGATVLGPEDRSVTRTVAPGAQVRLRLVNTDNNPQVYAVAGTRFAVVAVDGTDLNGPGQVGDVRLRVPAGGRYDVAFAMPSTPVTVSVGSVALTLAPPGVTGPVTDTAGPVLDLLHYGQPTDPPFGAAPDRRFTLVLDRGLALVGGAPSYAYTINGYAFPHVPVQTVRQGDLVEFTVVNRSQDTHPWHLHGHRVLVVSRDGVAPTGSPLWLDTFDVRPGEVWRVAFRADNPGLWMNHCHNLSHADNGMVTHLAYEGVTSPLHGAHGG